MIDSTLLNANILIVDDHKANIAVLEDFLEIQGYTNVTSTTDPREVINLYVSFQPDIILLDLSMPYMTGHEVMEQLKMVIAAKTYFPILVLTADISPDAKQRALSSGAYDFLTKPFHLLEVGLRIKNLLFTSYLQQQLKNQNHDLEEKVKERTKELEIRNVEMNAAKEKAEASDRIKMAFLANISHEIRTPLNGILGFAPLLVNTDYSVEEKQLFIDAMQLSSNRLIGTINNYVDMAKIVSDNLDVRKTKVRPAEILSEIKTRFQHYCDEKQLALNLVLPDEHSNLLIETDEELLKKAIEHLLDNAIKFTASGAVSVGFSIQTGEVDFFVKDTGIGIEKKLQDKIFEIFTQGDMSNTRSFEGSGLGLSITKGIINNLGGSLQLVSLKGEGTIVSFSLPAQIH